MKAVSPVRRRKKGVVSARIGYCRYKGKGMAWCPKCMSEYQEGIEVCADCGCGLVQELAGEDTKDSPADQEYTKEMFYEMDSSLVDKMKEEEVLKGVTDAGRLKERTPVYQNNREKAADNRSSGQMLIVTGVLGMAVVLCLFMDILPVRLNPVNKYLTCGAMSILFLSFLVMGVMSMKSARVFARQASKESLLSGEILGWCRESINPVELDAEIFSGEEAKSLEEELKYFRRFEEIKNRINRQFLNLDEAYLDYLIDELYTELFGDR